MLRLVAIDAVGISAGPRHRRRACLLFALRLLPASLFLLRPFVAAVGLRVLLRFPAQLVPGSGLLLLERALLLLSLPLPRVALLLDAAVQVLLLDGNDGGTSPLVRHL